MLGIICYIYMVKSKGWLMSKGLVMILWVGCMVMFRAYILDYKLSRALKQMGLFGILFGFFYITMGVLGKEVVRVTLHEKLGFWTIILAIGVFVWISLIIEGNEKLSKMRREVDCEIGFLITFMTVYFLIAYYVGLEDIKGKGLIYKELLNNGLVFILGILVIRIGGVWKDGGIRKGDNKYKIVRDVILMIFAIYLTIELNTSSSVLYCMGDEDTLRSMHRETGKVGTMDTSPPSTIDALGDVGADAKGGWGKGVEVSMAGFNKLPLKPRRSRGLGKTCKRIGLVYKGKLSKNLPCLLVGMVNILGALYLLVSLGLGGAFYFKLIVACIVGSMVMFRGYTLGYTFKRAILQYIWSLVYLKGSMLLLGLFLRGGVGDLLLKIPNFYMVWGVVLVFGVASIVISEVGVLRGVREKVEEEIGITITFSILVVISFSKIIAPSIEEGNIDNELMAKVVLLYSLGVLLIRLGRILELIKSRNVEISDLSRVTRDLVLIIIVLLLLLKVDGGGNVACYIVEGEGPLKATLVKR